MICWLFLLAACGTIADAADPDTAYRSPDATLIQSRLITRASGDLYRADPATVRARHPTVTRGDGTDDTPTIAFSLITGATPGARLRGLAMVCGVTGPEPQAAKMPIIAFRRDRAHRIRDGGDLSDPSIRPTTGETALRAQGGFSCPRRTE
jgi:hypothetical protein